MKTTHELSEEQNYELSSLSSPEIVNSFIVRLNNNYGGGEVLKYEHMLHIFREKLFKEPEGWLDIYVDTVRMLSLVGEGGSHILLDADYEKIVALHNTLFKKIDIDKELAPLYVNAVKKYKKLNQTILGKEYKTRFELISTIYELQDEGSSMEHCIASYANFVSSGNYIALRVFEENTNGRFTLGLHRSLEGFELSFDQLKGNGNQPANIQACLATAEFCKKNKIIISPTNNYDLFPIKNIL